MINPGEVFVTIPNGNGVKADQIVSAANTLNGVSQVTADIDPRETPTNFILSVLPIGMADDVASFLAHRMEVHASAS
jgi:hypothetical protein